MQFFADNYELKELLAFAKVERGLNVGVLLQHPFRIFPYTVQSFEDEVDLRHYVMSADELDCDVSGYMEFVDRNPSAMILTVIVEPDALRETVFTGASHRGNKHSEAIKRKIRSISKAGMRVKVGSNPVEGFMKNARYTNGAADYAANGGHLFGISHKHEYFVD